MRDATPRTLKQMKNRRTRYEVALLNTRTGASHVIGFTPRKSRIGLLRKMQKRGAEILDVVGEDDNTMDFFKDDAGRWTADFGNGWVARFTGYTERDVRTMNNEGS